MRAYAKLFSQGVLARANQALLGLTLHAEGYNNYQDFRVSGEEFFIEKILVPTSPKVCIDVGANRGDYSKHLLQKTSATVHAFEPHPVSFGELQQLQSEHGDRLKVHNLAMGLDKQSGTLNFNLSALGHASLSTEVNAVPYLRNTDSVEVQITTLDSWCQENGVTSIDLLKIDVEGFEDEVLIGARRVLEEIRPHFVQIEFNWHQLFRNTTMWSLSKYFEDYRLFQLVPGGWKEREPKDPLANLFRFSNFIFVRVSDSDAATMSR